MLSRLSFVLEHNQKRKTFNFADRLQGNGVSSVTRSRYDLCKSFIANSLLSKISLCWSEVVLLVNVDYKTFYVIFNGLHKTFFEYLDK